MIVVLPDTAADTIGERAEIKNRLQQGEARTLFRQLDRKFGTEIMQVHRARIEATEIAQLEVRLDRILSAETPETIFH